MPTDATQKAVRLEKALVVLALAGCTLWVLRAAVFPLQDLPRPVADQAQMTWNLWHVAESVLAGRDPYTTDRILFPVGADLATHTLAAGFLPSSLLVKAAVRLGGGDASLYPFIAYKCDVVLSFLLIASFTFLFLRAVGFSRAEALVPSAAYAFCPFYRHHANHLNLIAGFAIPLAAWLAVSALRRPSKVRLGVLAVVLGSTVYFSELILFVLLAGALLGLLLVASRSGRARLAPAMRSWGVAGLATAAGLFALCVLPFASHWVLSEALPPGPEEVSRGAANLAGFLVPDAAFTAGVPRFLAGLSRRVTIAAGGREAFPGFVLLGAALLGIAGGGTAARLSRISGFVFAVLSLGPTLVVFGTETGWPMPYAALSRLPLLVQHRTPVRIVAVAFLFATVPAALGVRRLLAALGKIAPKFPVAAGALTLLVLVAAENGPGATLSLSSRPIVDERLRRLPEGPVINLPWDDMSRHMAMQVIHGHPIATAYLARMTQEQREHLSRLDEALWNAPEKARDARIVSLYGSIVVDRPIPLLLRARLGRLGVPFVDLTGSRPPALLLTVGEPTGVGDWPERWGPSDLLGPRGRTIDLELPAAIRQVDVLADANDQYVVELSRKGDEVLRLVVPGVPGGGLRWRAAAVRADAAGSLVSRVVVRPGPGDGNFALRAVVLGGPAQSFVPAVSVAGARRDQDLPVSVDDPGEGQEVSSPLLVRGWCQDWGGKVVDLAEVFIDGEPFAVTGVVRAPRADVGRALPRIGNIERAGYELRLDVANLPPGEHVLVAVFASRDGRYRVYDARRFRLKR